MGAVCKKAHQRMFYLRKLCSFILDSSFMKMFTLVVLNLSLLSHFCVGIGHLMLKKQKQTARYC